MYVVTGVMCTPSPCIGVGSRLCVRGPTMLGSDDVGRDARRLEWQIGEGFSRGTRARDESRG